MLSVAIMLHSKLQLDVICYITPMQQNKQAMLQNNPQISEYKYHRWGSLFAGHGEVQQEQDQYALRCFSPSPRSIVSTQRRWYQLDALCSIAHSTARAVRQSKRFGGKRREQLENSRLHGTKNENRRLDIDEKLRLETHMTII